MPHYPLAVEAEGEEGALDRTEAEEGGEEDRHRQETEAMQQDPSSQKWGPTRASEDHQEAASVNA